MGLFGADVTLEFTPEDMLVLLKPIEGGGGHQTLLRQVLQPIRTAEAPTLTLQVTEADLQRVYRYANDYGGGGYQDRFKVILKAAWRAGWGQQ